MVPNAACLRGLSYLSLTSAVVEALRSTRRPEELADILQAVTREMTFRHFAVVHHDDLAASRPGSVDIKDYPAAIVERLVHGRRFRRDPVVRGCAFADGAFLWSDLSRLIRLDRHDHASLALGAREGLNEGITVPYFRLGHRMGSCTFAGTTRPERAQDMLGPAQMIGIFAFQSAIRLASAEATAPAAPPRLHPRPRDCIVLAGRGHSNKEIARALALAPRTVDGYMTEARELFGAHDRTELVISAVLAGEIGLDELASRQPE